MAPCRAAIAAHKVRGPGAGRAHGRSIARRHWGHNRAALAGGLGAVL